MPKSGTVGADPVGAFRNTPDVSALSGSWGCLVVMGVTLGGVPMGKPRRRGSLIASVTPDAPAPELRADAWRSKGTNVPQVAQYATEHVPERTYAAPDYATTPGYEAAPVAHGERVDGVRVRHRYDVTRQSVRDEQRAHVARQIMHDAGYETTTAHFDRETGKSAWLNDCLVELVHEDDAEGAIALLDEHLDACPSMAVEALDAKTGRGALAIAAAMDMPDVVGKLLKHGADPGLADDRAETDRTSGLSSSNRSRRG